MISKPIAEPLLVYALNKYSYEFFRRSTTLPIDKVTDKVIDIEAFLTSYNENLMSPKLRTVLETAYSSVALAYFGRTEKSETATTTSHKYYQHALEGIKDAVKGTAKNIPDELILIAMLLSAFEGKVGGMTYPSNFPNSYRHNYGAGALVTQRLETQPNRNRQSMLLDTIVRRRVICASINQNLRVPEGLRKGTRFIGSTTDRRLYDCMIELSDLRADAQDVMTSDHRSTSIQDLNEILLSAQALDLKLNQLQPAFSQYTVHSIREKQRLRGMPPLFHQLQFRHHYQDLKSAFDWNFYRASRLRVNAIIISVIQKVSRLSCPAVNTMKLALSRAEQLIETLVEDISASVPYYFGLFCDEEQRFKTMDELLKNVIAEQFGALVFPLHSIASSPTISYHHRRTARDVLLLVAQILGNTGLLRFHGPGGIFWIPDDAQ